MGSYNNILLAVDFHSDNRSVIDKAVEAFTGARNKSYELGLYTDYTQSALSELSRIRPEEYPPNAEALPAPEYTSNPYSTVGFAK